MNCHYDTDQHQYEIQYNITLGKINKCLASGGVSEECIGLCEEFRIGGVSHMFIGYLEEYK